MRDVPHVGYPVRLGYGVEEVAVGVVLGVTVIGTEVTIVEPCALVVARLANDVAGTVLPDGAFPLEMLPDCGAVVPEGSVDELEDCAAEGGAAKLMAAKRKRE
jgi:hypothetical protein